jgi:hypothetical protein
MTVPDGLAFNVAVMKPLPGAGLLLGSLTLNLAETNNTADIQQLTILS